MFQRLSNLLFGEVEEVAAELNGPKPCVTEADEEGWMLVNLPGEWDCSVLTEETVEAQLLTPSCPDSSPSQSHDSNIRTLRRPPTDHLSHTRRVLCKEGATAETSPMEDLLIEHPSMSVYVSPSNMSMVSNGNLSVVAEESMVSLAGSLSRMTKAATNPATRSTKTTRGSRGAAAQAGILAKVTQVARVQRGKAHIERRHLSCNRIQRQNRTKEQAPRRAAHIRNSFLHQPSKRNFCH